MEESIKLGGNIELEGFNEVGKAEMVIVKKIVGNYAKDISEKVNGFKSVKVTLSEEEDGIKVAINVEADNALISEETGKNIFVVIDNAFKKIISQI